MIQPLKHSILIVDDEDQQGKYLISLLNGIGADIIYEATDLLGIERIRSVSTPFSMVISDQKMPQMSGSEFLEQVKELSPSSIRFLTCDHSDFNAVADAVNKGIIHRYFKKPLKDNTLFIETVKSGLNQYEILHQEQHLFKIAKKQNAKLYRLNQDLRKKFDQLKNKAEHLEDTIEKIKNRLHRGVESLDYISDIEHILKNANMLAEDNISMIFSALANDFHGQFNSIAADRGFEKLQKE